MVDRKKILTVIGARPQFIKAAPVSMALKKSGRFREVLVHTGQHYDRNMSGVFFKEMGIPHPDYNLEAGSGTHAEQTGNIMQRLEPLLIKEKPAMVLIYGDTNSTLAAALTAAKLHIPVVHVEAGLRSFNMEMPEEINRIVADRLSSLLFAPTRTAVENLKREGIRCNVFKTGDVMYDAARIFSEKARKTSRVLENLRLKPGAYRLATVHRAENTDDKTRLRNILKALSVLGREMPLVFPVHPRTRKMIDRFGLAQHTQGLVLIEPAGFLDMVSLEAGAALILTDSGGVQKEAYFHRVPCVTLRNETEWVETVASGWNVLADVRDPGKILAVATAKRKNRLIHEYGNGKTAEFIVGKLCAA
jgi:UDP-GlcNAc3NAcA epimerase